MKSLFCRDFRFLLLLSTNNKLLTKKTYFKMSERYIYIFKNMADIKFSLYKKIFIYLVFFSVENLYLVEIYSFKEDNKERNHLINLTKQVFVVFL